VLLRQLVAGFLQRNWSFCRLGIVHQRWASNLFLKIGKSQICKFVLSFRRRKSTNFLGLPVSKTHIRKIFVIKLHIANRLFLQNTHKLTTLSQSSPKSCLFKAVLLFFAKLCYIILAIFVRRKSMYLRTCGTLSPLKRLGLQIGNPQNKNPQVRKFANFFLDLQK
jgi:hypothetical protein